MAPKMSARGLESSAEAAPVLSGGPPELVEEPEGLLVAETVAVRERVAETMVLLRPAEGLMVAEAAALETREFKLAMTEEAEARALETAAEAADEAEAMAEDREPDPPVRPNCLV